MFTHEYWMKKALGEALKAFQMGEVPVGAVIVKGHELIGKAGNQVEMLKHFQAGLFCAEPRFFQIAVQRYPVFFPNIEALILQLQHLTALILMYVEYHHP